MLSVLWQQECWKINFKWVKRFLSVGKQQYDRKQPLKFVGTLRYCFLINGISSYWASLVVQLVKNPPAYAGDLGTVSELGRSPGEGKGYSLQYSGLENSMDYIVHVVAKSRTWLSHFHSSYRTTHNKRTGKAWKIYCQMGNV